MLHLPSAREACVFCHEIGLPIESDSVVMKAAPISIVGESITKMTNPGRREDSFVFGRYTCVWLDTNSPMKVTPFNSVNTTKSPNTAITSTLNLKPKSSNKTKVTSSPAPKIIDNSKHTTSLDSKISKRWADDSDSSDDSEEDWEKNFDEEDETIQYWGNGVARVDQNRVLIPPTVSVMELISDYC